MTHTPQTVPFERLLPHQPPMRAVDRLVSWSAEEATCEATLRAGAPYFEQGVFQPVWLLEFLAQAMGAGVAFGALTAQEPREAAGFVVGADEWNFTPSPRLVPGAALRLVTRVDHDIPPAAEHSVHALLGDGEEVARGRLRMLIGGAPPPPPPQPASALEGFQGCRFEVAGTAVRITVGSGHPYLDGHFPGQPVLPAVGHLRFVEHAAGLVLSRSVALATVGRARFQDPVRPGDVLDLTLETEALPELRWTFRAGGRTVSRGTGTVRGG